MFGCGALVRTSPRLLRSRSRGGRFRSAVPSAGEGLEAGLTANAKVQTAPAIKSSLSGAMDAAVASNPEAADIGNALSVESQSEMVSGLEKAAIEALDSATDTATEKITSSIESQTNAISDLRSGVSDAVDASREFSTKATENVSESLQAASDYVSSSVSDISQQVQSILDSATQQIESLGRGISTEVQSTIQSVEDSLQILQRQASEALPPEVKESIETVKFLLRSAAEVASTYRTPLLIAAALLLGYAGYSYYNYRFVGYSGDIYPEKVLELLESDAPALLVDIRSEDMQQRDGIPKLRRKALGKAISIPLFRLGPGLNNLRIGPEFNADVTATYIAGHRQASKFTNYVIMTENEEQGRRVARSLRKLECPNSFVMFGGFSAWTKAELPVSESAVYEVTPIDVISDKTLEIAEPLAKPSYLIPVSLGVSAAAWSIWNYRYVLQLLGVLGPSIGFIVYLLKKYDTPEEFLDDLDKTLKAFASPPTVKASEVGPAENLTEEPKQNDTPVAESKEESVIAES